MDKVGSEYGINLSPEEFRQGVDFLTLLEYWNQRINLTSVQDREELVRYHLMEGFLAGKILPRPVSAIADIGSGAGFPGIPMHILAPSRKTFFIEKNLKKATFLSTALRKLALPGQVTNLRAEDAQIWDGIEIASARALKLSADMLNLLRDSGICLLLMEGKMSQLAGTSWEKILESPLPFSKNRYMRIFQPDVSRGTIRWDFKK